MRQVELMSRHNTSSSVSVSSEQRTLTICLTNPLFDRHQRADIMLTPNVRNVHVCVAITLRERERKKQQPQFTEGTNDYVSVSHCCNLSV